MSIDLPRAAWDRAVPDIQYINKMKALGALSQRQGAVLLTDTFLSEDIQIMAKRHK